VGDDFETKARETLGLPAKVTFNALYVGDDFET